jgi:GWxTD domain-containing protein
MKVKWLCLMTLFLLAVEMSAVRVIFDYRVFHAPGEGPYVEFVTSFDAATFKHVPADSGLVQAHAELNLIVSRLGSIVDFRKVRVDGPQVKMGEEADFLSVERFMLPCGIYELEVEVSDLGAQNGVKESMSQKIEINNPSSGVFISDIQFVSAYRPSTEDNAFSKSGYDMLPFVSNYFPTSLNSIIFYSEIYRSDSVFGAGNGFLSTVCVLDAAENEIENCKRMKREKAASVVPMLQVLDISDLPTGEFKVRVEVRSRENQLVYIRERKFSRNKINAITETPAMVKAGVDEVASSFAATYTDKDSLYSLILWHIPIAGDADKYTIDRQLENSELAVLQGFLYNFWYKRDSADPEGAFRAYEQNCKIVKDNFETRIKPGWQTERGRVYLQYGKPNTRIVRPHDPDYWPFEIWHYYETDNNLHNRRFLFYDTTLMGDMELLHSDVPAEPKNFNWKEMVRSRPSALNMSDASRNNANQRVDTNSRDEIDNLWFTPH